MLGDSGQLLAGPEKGDEHSEEDLLTFPWAEPRRSPRTIAPRRTGVANGLHQNLLISMPAFSRE